MIQVSFSGGRSSAMMAKIMAENQAKDDMIFMFANTGKEMPETLDFVHECDQRWELGVVWIEYCPINKYKVVTYETASRNGEPFEALIQKKGFVPNRVARYCTADLKIRAMKAYLISIGYNHWDAALGIRYDEPKRYHKLRAADGKDRWDYTFPLWDFKITKADVMRFWSQQGFDLRIHSNLGNCDFCFLKGRNKKISQANLMPERLQWWIDMEAKYASRFCNDYSMEQLKTQALQPSLFDDTIDCFCGD